MMPRLAFLTSLDHFVLVSTLVVFLSMVEVIYTAYLSTSGQLEKARKMDRKARWIIPLLYIALTAETLFLRVWI
jgi:cadmium resistance protein CadD (predicted permease)